MPVRVMLVAPAVNEGLRQARFGGDSPLDEVGQQQARAAAAGLPPSTTQTSSPSLRCRQTATVLGLDARSLTELDDLDMGRWHGRSLEEVTESEPRAVATWLSDPDAAPHGGESLTGLVGRVGAWLNDRADGTERVLAVVEPAVIRAALVHALGLPPQVFWRLDVRPLSLTEITGRAGRWNLHCGRPLAPVAATTGP